MKRPTVPPIGRFALPVLAAYGGVSFLYFGLRLLLEPGSQYAGPSDDSQIFIWSLAWWPHAILHGENPFVTHALWAPSGLDLAWTTSVPGLALLLSPVTLAAGPVAAFNVAAVLVPALAAWTAFLLCRRLTHALWPSFAGGYLFGFSSYVLGQQVGGHLHMTAVFLVPLVALAIFGYLDDGRDGRWLVVRLGPLLALQLLLSTEVTFGLGLVVAVALVLAAALVPARRPGLRSLVVPLAGSCALALLLTAPFLYYLLTDFHSQTFNRPEAYVADLLNFVVPTHLSLAGRGWTGWLRFRGNIAENGAFLGPGSVLVVVLFGVGRRRTAGGRFLLAALALAVLVSLGQLATVNGHGVLELPWRYIVDLPVFDNLLTTRLTVYVSLTVAVIVALWAAALPSGSRLRWALPAIAMLSIVPNPWLRDWATTYTIPSFFTDRAYAACLDPGETILPLPIGFGGQADLWQVESDFRFRMAGGRLAPLPPPPFMHPDSIAYVSQGLSPRPDEAALLAAYIRAEGVTSVVVDLRERQDWEPVLNTIATGQVVGGVVLYHFSALPPSCFGG